MAGEQRTIERTNLSGRLRSHDWTTAPSIGFIAPGTDEVGREAYNVRAYVSHRGRLNLCVVVTLYPFRRQSTNNECHKLEDGGIVTSEYCHSRFLPIIMFLNFGVRTMKELELVALVR